MNIGVIIPTFNVMPEIKAHVDALNRWISEVPEVLVVDSQSSDGTVEYLKKHLSHPSLQIKDHPPGLYQSWNAAVSQVSAKYIYIATVGDYMPFETLERLYQAAESQAADVVVSPPQIISSGGDLLTGDWPIHDLIKLLPPEGLHLLSPLERFVWNISDLPGTLIGSSASNLYRASLLKSSPFPLDYGHAGDSAWALGRPSSERWFILKDGQSRFVKHESVGIQGSKARLSRSKLYRLAIDAAKQLRMDLDQKKCEEVHQKIDQLLQLYFEKESLSEGFREIRSGRLPWYFYAKGWQVRARRKQIIESIVELKTYLRGSVTNAAV